MLQTLALAAALSFAPAQGGLELSNDRLTFGGLFGPVRPDNRFLPGDLFFLAFDIEGLKANSQGKVEYLMGMTLTQDGTNKVLLDNKPAEQTATLPLGATRLPAQAYVILGLDLKGPCTCKVTVTDKATNATKTIEKKFSVSDPTFGIVCFHTSYDREGDLPAPMLGVAGQLLWMHFRTVSFTRNPQGRQPHNQVEMRVYDGNGKAVTDEPLVYEIKSGVDEDVSGLDWHLPLPLNRPGRYSVELKATDRISGKEYKMRFPLSVYDSVK